METQERKTANQYGDHLLSDEQDPYYFVKESGSANQPTGKDVKMHAIGFKKGSFVKSTVNEAFKIIPVIDSHGNTHPSGLTKDENNIQDEKDIQMEVSNATTEIGSKEVADAV